MEYVWTLHTVCCVQRLHHVLYRADLMLFLLSLLLTHRTLGHHLDVIRMVSPVVSHLIFFGADSILSSP